DQDGRLIHSSTGALFTGAEMLGRLDLQERAFQAIKAEHGTLERRGEVSRVTNQQTQEAALTYVDLLTLRSTAAGVPHSVPEAPGRVEQARKGAAGVPAAQVEVPRAEGTLAAQRQTLLNLEEKAAAAGAKLAQLLGLEGCVDMRPIDSQLLP